MTFTNCGTANPAGSKFCPPSGQGLPVRLPCIYFEMLNYGTYVEVKKKWYGGQERIAL